MTLSTEGSYKEFLKHLTSDGNSTLGKIFEILVANDHRSKKQEKAEKLTKVQIAFLIERATRIFNEEETLVEIEPPVYVCGDTHGQFGDTLDIVELIGWPPNSRYLFMGDYVDRGDQSIELICLMFLLKIRFPTNVFLLRGNHETAEVNKAYGFKDDCLASYDVGLWDAFSECFKYLPLVAVVGSRIICMHGGLSPCFYDLDDLRNMPRPLDVPDKGLACDLLWSDPTPPEDHVQICGYQLNNQRKTSVFFCSEVVKEFLDRNELDLLVRGHELMDYGYQFTPDKKVLTIFTAPFYCDHPNDAAVLHVDEKLQCRILVYIFKKPVPHQEGAVAKSTELWNEVTLRDANKTATNASANTASSNSDGTSSTKEPAKLAAPATGATAEGQTSLSYKSADIRAQPVVAKQASDISAKSFLAVLGKR